MRLSGLWRSMKGKPSAASPAALAPKAKHRHPIFVEWVAALVDGKAQPRRKASEPVLRELRYAAREHMRTQRQSRRIALWAERARSDNQRAQMRLDDLLRDLYKLEDAR